MLTNLDAPTGIVLDQPNDHLYFVTWDQGQVRGSLHRANLQGQNHVVLRSGIDLPLQLGLDKANGRIYWSNENPPSVQSTDLDGNDLQTLVTDTGTLEKGPYGLAILDSAFISNPSISWPAPAAITYGMPLGNGQLNATATVPGTFSYSPPAGTVLNAGDDQPLLVTFTPDDPRYNVTQASVTIDVAPAPLTITADSLSMPAGGPLPSLTASYAGFVNGDTPAALDTPVQLVTSATPGSPPGAYPIVASGAIDANYAISFVNGTLTVLEPDQVVLKWYFPLTVAYGTPLGNGQLNATATVPGTFVYSPPAGTVLNAGDDQPLLVTFTPDDTTSPVLQASVTIDVAPAPLTITADSLSMPAGGPLPSLTASYAGFVNGDTPAALDTPVQLVTSATPGSPPGAYPIAASGAIDANYSITFVGGVLEIVAPPPSLYWTDYAAKQVKRISSGSTQPEVLLSLPANADPRAVVVDSNAGVLYLADWGLGIVRANLDGSALTSLYPAATGATGLALDATTGSLYWTVASAGQIVRGRVDGSTPAETLISTNTSNPEALALDPANAKLYWSNTANGSVWRANLDGSGAQPLLSGMTTSIGIALDLAHGHLYAVEWGGGQGVLRRANLDGSNQQVVLSGFGHPLQLALDPLGQRLYWSTYAPASLQSVRLDGSDLQTISNVGDPWGLAVASSTSSQPPTGEPITWPAPAAITYGMPLGNGQLNATATVPGTFSYSPPAGTVLNAGDDQPLLVTFTPDDTTSPVLQASVTIDVAPAPLTITADSL
ncbi:MAG TPA: MBG domain-containing protein, partial [Roseiflexaceae bacterium]|nr:MBG domain-containing protein [Roseiflexaceae bacterium]